MAVNELTIIIVADSTNRDNIRSLIESIRSFNDVEALTVILFDNEAGGDIREWGSSQEDIIFAYSDEGEIPYGKVITDIVNELDPPGDILLVPGTHLLVPGVLSGMLKILRDSESNGIVGANFLGSEFYGLGKDFLIKDYREIAEYSMSCSYEPYEVAVTDPKGTLLIRGELLKKIISFGETKSCSAEKLKQILCVTVEKAGFVVMADRADFWGDCSFKNENMESGEGILVSICVPTYNRGKCALDLGKSLVEERRRSGLEDRVQIVFSDNGSENEKDHYLELREMSEREKNFKYRRNSENLGFVKNMMEVLAFSDGRFSLVLSDEDRLFWPGFKTYIMYLEQHPEIGMMKGRTDKMYKDELPVYALAGKYALLSFYLRGNYVSGVIYNRELLTDSKIKQIHDTFGSGNRAYYWYPHIFWETWLQLNSVFASSDIPLVFECEPAEFDSTTDEITGKPRYTHPDDRIAQGLGYTDMIKKMDVQDDEISLYLFLNAYAKTLFLLRGSIMLHGEAIGSREEVVEKAEAAFKKELMKISFSDTDYYRSLAYDFMTSERAKFMTAP